MGKTHNYIALTTQITDVSKDLHTFSLPSSQHAKFFPASPSPAFDLHQACVCLPVLASLLNSRTVTLHCFASTHRWHQSVFIKKNGLRIFLLAGIMILNNQSSTFFRFLER